MFEIVNEEIFKILIWKKIVPNRIYYIIENGVLVAVDPPAGGFAKISDFFPCDLSKWNLGENFRFVKFKIFEWKLVFPLIFADDFFKIFHSGIFWNCVGGISFSDKFGGIVRDFIFIFIFRIRHFRREIHVGEFFPRFFWVNLAGQRKRFFVGKVKRKK